MGQKSFASQNPGMVWVKRDFKAHPVPPGAAGMSEGVDTWMDPRNNSHWDSGSVPVPPKPNHSLIPRGHSTHIPKSHPRDLGRGENEQTGFRDCREGEQHQHSKIWNCRKQNPKETPWGEKLDPTDPKSHRGNSELDVGDPSDPFCPSPAHGSSPCCVYPGI